MWRLLLLGDVPNERAHQGNSGRRRSRATASDFGEELSPAREQLEKTRLVSHLALPPHGRASARDGRGHHPGLARLGSGPVGAIVLAAIAIWAAMLFAGNAV